MLLTFIIALLISLGVISSSDTYENLSDQEKQEMVEKHEIIIHDDLTF